MKQEETLATSHKSLIDSILEIMIKNGIGRTTMDHISSTLKISKRTLYEIFFKQRLSNCRGDQSLQH